MTFFTSVCTSLTAELYFPSGGGLSEDDSEMSQQFFQMWEGKCDPLMTKWWGVPKFAYLVFHHTSIKKHCHTQRSLVCRVINCHYLTLHWPLPDLYQSNLTRSIKLVYASKPLIDKPSWTQIEFSETSPSTDCTRLHPLLNQQLSLLTAIITASV